MLLAYIKMPVYQRWISKQWIKFSLYAYDLIWQFNEIKLQHHKSSEFNSAVQYVARPYQLRKPIQHFKGSTHLRKKLGFDGFWPRRTTITWGTTASLNSAKNRSLHIVEIMMQCKQYRASKCVNLQTWAKIISIRCISTREIPHITAGRRFYNLWLHSAICNNIL